MGDKIAWERIERLEIEGEIDSDYRSLTVRLDGEKRRAKREARENEEERWVPMEDQIKRR